jgi:hypothetical protein
MIHFSVGVCQTTITAILHEHSHAFLIPEVVGLGISVLKIPSTSATKVNW